MNRLDSNKTLNTALASVFAATALAYFVLFGYTTIAYEGKFSPDSIFYVDTANNLLAGRGLSTSMAELERVIEQDERLPKPMTVWGPGYPIAIAALSAIGIPTAAAALIIAVAGYALILALAWRLTARAVGGASGALAAATLLYFAPLRDVSRHAWSETLAMALALAMFAALGTGNRKLLWPALLAGLLAGTAVATRYAFMPLIIIGLIGTYRPYTRSVLARSAAFTIPAFAIAGAVLGRNLALTGHAGGARWHSAGRPLLDGISEAALAIPSALSFSSPGLLGGAAIVLALSAAWRYRSGERGPSATVTRATVLAILAWPILYFAFLLAAQTRVAVDAIDDRLLFPATFVIALSTLAALLAVFRPHRIVALSCAVLLAGHAAWSEAQNARMLHRAGLPPVYDATRVLSKPGALAWLASNATPDDLIIAQDALDWPRYLGPVPTMFFSFEGAPSRFGYRAIAGYLVDHECGAYRKVFVAIVLPARGDSPAETPFYDDLAAGNLAPYPALSELARGEDYAVFEIDCDRLEAVSAKT